MAIKRARIDTTSLEHDQLTDHETWLAILEPALCEDTAAVECLARLMFTIKKAIEGGTDGVKQAGNILSTGIELMYLYTDAHKAARNLYLLSLAGHLKPQDEPLQLINEAIKRSAVESESMKKKKVRLSRRRVE